MNPALPTIDREYAVDLLADLVRINSVNPMTSQGGAGRDDPDQPGEYVLALRLAQELRALGAAVELSPAEEAGEDAERRPNVTGRWKGRGDGPEVILCSHLDTVDVSGMDRPFEPAVQDGRMFGRGSLDAKGQLVMFLAAVHAAQNCGNPLPADVTFAAVSDEEDQSVGARSLLKALKGDFCVVGEPTGLDLVIAHKGFFWIEIEAQGKAVHGSVPEQGIDAIAKMADVIRALEGLKPSLKERVHPLLEHPKLHMGVIEGGSGPSTVPDRCRLTAEVRTCRAGETEEIFALIQESLARLAEADSDLWADARLGVVRHPMEISADHPLVSGLSSAVEVQLGKRPERTVMGAWTDAGLFAEKMPTVIFGPGELRLAHSHEESVPIDEVVEGAAIILRFLASPPRAG
ncbi:MAG: M20 family metallopeptidase [Nitrospinota bacterium]